MALLFWIFFKFVAVDKKQKLKTIFYDDIT